MYQQLTASLLILNSFQQYKVYYACLQAEHILNDNNFTAITSRQQLRENTVYLHSYPRTSFSTFAVYMTYDE